MENQENNQPQAPLQTAPKRRFWRKLLIRSGLVLGGFLLTLVAVAAFLGGPICSLLIDSVNQSLKKELKVGKPKLSLLSDFPNASVRLLDVELEDVFGYKLLRCDEISFRVGLFSLFSDQIEVKSVLIRDGALNLFINRQGRSGFDVFKSDEETTEASGVKLALQNAEMEDMEVRYTNDATRQKIALALPSASLSGNFSETRFNLASEARMHVHDLEMDKHHYLIGEDLSYGALIKVDLESGEYNIQQLDLELGDNVFTLEGLALYKEKYTDMDLKLKSREGDVSVVFDLLPDAYHTYFKDFNSSGLYSCAGTIKGRLSAQSNPAMHLQVHLKNGQLVSEKLQAPIRNVSFDAIFDVRPGTKGRFEINDFNGKFGGYPFSFDLNVNNLDDPGIELACEGTLPLAAVYGLLGNDAITSGNGLVHISGLGIKGKVSDMSDMNKAGRVQATGALRFEDAQLVYKKIFVTAREGKLELLDNTFSIDGLDVKAGKSDFMLNASASNLLPVLFADSLNSSNAFLNFDADLNIANLDVDELIQLLSIVETEDEVGAVVFDSLRMEQMALREHRLDKLRGNFKAKIAGFKYGKIQGQNFDGNLDMRHNRLRIDGRADAMRGQFALFGEAVFERKPTLNLLIQTQHVNLRALMDQCENFGQDVIVAENLEGDLDSRVAVYAFWDEHGELDWDKMRAYIDLGLHNGALKNLEMLESFSDYVHIQDLRNVQFAPNMQNYLELQGQTLHIPVMFVQSNAFNLHLSGTQDFDDNIDYKIKVNAAQAAFQRIKAHDKSLSLIPAEKGLFNVFYTIKGTIDKYEIKRGKREVKTAFERSESRKKNIEAILNQAFNSANVQTGDELFLDPITAGGS